jgi:sugar phosphate isomerase/epimerase
MGYDGLELAAVGDLAPAQLGASARREIRHLFASHQLSIAAVAAPLRFGLDVLEHQEARIDFVRQTMTLSFDLGCRLVVVQPGAIPKDEGDPRRAALIDALSALGRHGDRVGATLALETGVDAPADVMALLAKIDAGGLAIAYNPGFLVVHGHDPYAAARAFHGRMAYVHATDARRGLSPRLVPVGRGDLDWLELIGVFTELDYRGFLTVDIEPGSGSANEAEAAATFLRRLLK